eukprot:5264904-Amphidinium_carterae.2
MSHEVEKHDIRVGLTIQEFGVGMEGMVPVGMRKELGIPELRHEYVKWVLSVLAYCLEREREHYCHTDCRSRLKLQQIKVSLEWPQAERCQILAVLTELRKQAILSQEDMQWAVIRLLGQLNDLSLDNPDIASVATEQLRELMKQGLIEQ